MKVRLHFQQNCLFACVCTVNSHVRAIAVRKNKDAAVEMQSLAFHPKLALHVMFVEMAAWQE